MTLITAIVATVGAFIAYFQWRTAHQRVVLDLFDRRLQIFEDVEAAVKDVFASTNVTNETFFLLVKANGKARFLFGKEVNSHLQTMIEDFAWRMTFNDQIIDGSGDERQENLEKKHEVVLRIVDFPKTGQPLFEPYLSLTQKMPSTWLPF
jgi:hypothetical protein